MGHVKFSTLNTCVCILPAVTGGKRKRDEEQAAEGGDSEAEDTTPLREKVSQQIMK